MTKLSSSSSTNRLRATKSRDKEQRRCQNINKAFASLQQRIPYLRPEERNNLPKIKTLRLAMRYIHHLTRLVDGNQMADPVSNETRPLTLPDFRQVVTDEMRTRNSYRERAHSEEMDPEVVQRILAREEMSRRRPMIGIPGEMREQPRQFGPISNNIHNINFNQYNVYQMMVPYGQTTNYIPQNQNVWKENQYMMNNHNIINNSNHFSYH